MPESPCPFVKDTIIGNPITTFSFVDRLRILFGRKVRQHIEVDVWLNLPETRRAEIAAMTQAVDPGWGLSVGKMNIEVSVERWVPPWRRRVLSYGEELKRP